MLKHSLATKMSTYELSRLSDKNGMYMLQGASIEIDVRDDVKLTPEAVQLNSMSRTSILFHCPSILRQQKHAERWALAHDLNGNYNVARQH